MSADTPRDEPPGIAVALRRRAVAEALSATLILLILAMAIVSGPWRAGMGLA